jgi:dihydroorotase
MDFDLLLRGGRLIDPASGVDAARDVAFARGRVAAIDQGIPPDRASKVVDATGRLVTPGLIDLHSHVYWGGTSLGVDADALAAMSGTTTYVDAGSAGAGNFLGFRAHVIERSKVRILAYINISFPGIFGFAKSLMYGECGDLVLCNPRETVACARVHEDVVVGVKVRAGRIAGAGTATAPIELAIEAADALHRPVMAHIDEPPPTQSDTLQFLRPADVLTHCYRPFPNAAVTSGGEIRDAVLKARERGVVFDIGHGMGSFDFEIARAMLKSGFAPDVISSDVHLLNVGGPAFDLLVCMSKLLVLGMPLAEIIRCATANPAKTIGRSDLGVLTVGSVGDAAVLREEAGPVHYVDSVGQTLAAETRLVSEGIVFGGEWRPNDAHGPSIEATEGRAGPAETQAAILKRHLGHRHNCGH